jgi:hypothetical protein
MQCHVHSVPGRLRIRLPRLKGRPEAAGPVCAGVERLFGVRSARTNPVTGSIVVEYDPAALEDQTILEHLVEVGEIPHTRLPRHGEVAGRKVGQVGQAIGMAIARNAFERTLEGSALSLLALVL